MRLARTLVAAAATVALVAAPVASATAATPKPAPKPRLSITALQVIGKSSYDVTHAAAQVKVRVQVKDFDKQLDPTGVDLVIVEKQSGTMVGTFSATTHRVGRSKVVSSWLGSITVPQAQAAAAPTTYCIVSVDIQTADRQHHHGHHLALNISKGLARHACFTVTNTLT